MRNIRTFFFSLHRIGGTLISLLFLMWFITGLVLIYHNFPDLRDSHPNEKKEVLSSQLPPINESLSQISDTSTITGIRIYQFQGQTLVDVNTSNGERTICADVSDEIKPVNRTTIDNTVKRWNIAPVLRIDTLTRRDQWIMYSYYQEKMPIYKFYFDDKEHHQLYVAARTSEVLQYTSKTQRFWAWVGAIPHKFYYTCIRRNTDNWILLLKILGFVGAFISLTGLYMAIYVTYKRYKNKQTLVCPYKKLIFRWHYITGFIFGLFLFTWAFSGAMAMQKIPQWIVKTYGDYRVSPNKVRGNVLSMAHYRLDYRKVLQKFKDVKEISTDHFRSIPIYRVVTSDSTFCVDASTDSVKGLFIPSFVVNEVMDSLYGAVYSYSLSEINEYEEYYLSRDGGLPLPAYKVVINNEDKSRFYIDPKTGDFQYYNRNRMAKKWVFSGLHYLKIRCLYVHPILWYTVIWILCIGGICVSLTGVVLGVRFIKKKLRY